MESYLACVGVKKASEYEEKKISSIHFPTCVCEYA